MHQERCARKAAWDSANKIYKLKNIDKTMIYVPGEEKGMPAPTTSEERQFVVDSGASMHMMSKKELSPAEMGTVKRSRNPAVVLTANDLNSSSPCNNSMKRLLSYRLASFAKITDTPMSGSAVKSHDWPKMGKASSAKHNFVPLVVPRLSVNSGSSSSRTSLPQESLRPEADQASGNRAASSSSSGSVFERSDEQVTRRLGQESLRSDKKDANDPLADLPQRLEDFTDNLEDTEVPALAHISQDSDQEHPTKVVTKSRKHCIYTHFPKDRTCDVCL